MLLLLIISSKFHFSCTISLILGLNFLHNVVFESVLTSSSNVMSHIRILIIREVYISVLHLESI